MIKYLTIALLSLCLFLYGFFPMVQNKVSKVPVKPSVKIFDKKLNSSHLYEPYIDKLVLIVIDALRIDFVTKDYMPFVISAALEKGCVQSVRAEAPTVTLPRIKALTTGNVPQFLDIIFNLGESGILYDSLLHRAVDQGKRIVFYGDDIWLKLFPNIFTRSEGVSAFYVNDYTEVDDNVTRNVLLELKLPDWDIMILHYLGLDHIGHIHGPQSPLISEKLAEMDNVVKSIYLATEDSKSRTLIVVTGDHGMRDSGGHGGASSSEVNVPLVALGLPCVNGSAAQTDISATLAALMGLDFPANSIGRVLSNLLTAVPVQNLLNVLRNNIETLNPEADMCGGAYKDALILHEHFIKENNDEYASEARNLYEQCLLQISEKLVHSSVNQDLYSLAIATGCLLVCFCAVLSKLLRVGGGTRRIEQIVLIVSIAQQFFLPSNELKTVFFMFAIAVLLLRYFKVIGFNLKRQISCDITFLQIVSCVLHPMLLHSSSFIDEEHQIWYFYLGTFIMVHMYASVQKSWLDFIEWLVLFAVLRFVRTINQTGDRWASLPDLKYWFLLKNNAQYLHLFFLISLMLAWVSCYICRRRQKYISMYDALILLLIYVFRIYTEQNPILGKLIWFLVFLDLLLVFFQNRGVSGIIVCWILLCSWLMRMYNVILIPACVLASFVLGRHIGDRISLAIAHIYLGNALYFCQGHSNSLASVDVSSGYLSLQQYVPSVVIMLVLCHTYAFHILTHLLLLRKCGPNTAEMWSIFVTHRLLTLITVCIIAVCNRYHLFVWSVFTPKLLIESSHFAILFLEVFIFFFVNVVCIPAFTIKYSKKF